MIQDRAMLRYSVIEVLPKQLLNDNELRKGGG